MADRYSTFVNAPVLRNLASSVGLPQPVELDRYKPGDPVVKGRVLVGEAPEGRLTNAIADVLRNAGVEIAGEANGNGLFKGLVFDASGIKDSTQLRELWAFFQPTIRRVERSGRVVVLGTSPEDCKSPREATAQRALEGFVRSVGKEVRRGSTAQLVYVAPGAEDQLAATLRFLLSPRSAYVSGQVVRIGPGGTEADIDWRQPLVGRVALVTGASRESASRSRRRWPATAHTSSASTSRSSPAISTPSPKRSRARL